MFREVPAAGVQQYQHLEAAQPHFTTTSGDSRTAELKAKIHVKRNCDVAQQQDY